MTHHARKQGIHCMKDREIKKNPFVEPVNDGLFGLAHFHSAHRCLSFGFDGVNLSKSPTITIVFVVGRSLTIWQRFVVVS